MPDNDQPAPSAFREMTDAFTDGCGCACHTGAGYNSSCDHCTADPSPSTVDEALPLLTIAEARAFLYRVISDYLEEGDYLPGEEPLVAVAEFEAAVRREEQQAAADLHDGTMRGYEYEVLAHTRTKAALASALTRAEEAEVALHSCSCEASHPTRASQRRAGWRTHRTRRTVGRRRGPRTGAARGDGGDRRRDECGTPTAGHRRQHYASRGRQQTRTRRHCRRPWGCRTARGGR
jgi:hypothetical protein